MKMRLYHLSNYKLSQGYVLNPRVPKNSMELEDRHTPRVCLSPSINGCLTAMTNVGIGSELHVYECVVKPYQPTLLEVPDSFITGEVWSLKPVKNYKNIGKLKITGYIGCKVDDLIADQFSYEFFKKESED